MTTHRKKLKKHPFDLWFDFKKYRCVVITQGTGAEDFQCEPLSMIAQLRRAATKRGIRVKLSCKGKSIIIKKGGNNGSK